jgi:hypothetical protein
MEKAGMDQETIVVRLKPDAARAVQSGRLAGASGTDLEPLARVLDELGIRLVPQHPGVSDPVLETWFTVSGEPPAERARIAGILDALPAVDGAFVKAPASPP